MTFSSLAAGRARPPYRYSEQCFSLYLPSGRIDGSVGGCCLYLGGSGSLLLLLKEEVECDVAADYRSSGSG